MKTVAKVILLTFLAMTAAAFLRGGCRRFFPGLYAGIWGGVPSGSSLNGGASTRQDVAHSQAGGLQPRAQREGSPLLEERGKGREVTPVPLRVTGYVIRGTHATVRLSDGRVLFEKDVAEIESRFVRLRSGDVIPIADPSSLPSVGTANMRVGSSSDFRSGQKEDTAPARRDEGAWVRDADGVARLRETPTLAPKKEPKV